MFDSFTWTPTTVFMVVKLCVMVIFAGYLGWKQAAPYTPPKPPKVRPRWKPGYTEAERIDT
jgi:hypothetical protein